MSRHFKSWDEKWDIAHPGNREETLTFGVEHFISCAKEAIKMHNYFAVALSGGSTPKALFSQLSSPLFSSELDWRKVLLFWGDERACPPTDKESNFRMAMDAGLKKLSIPKEHIFRMKAEERIEENADEYAATIQKALKGRPFDLVMLGMGNDGHTASLFPETDGLKESRRWVVANYVPQKKGWRMTLTYPCINRAHNIVIYVIGKGKAPMITRVFKESPSPALPIQLIGHADNKALWILDTEAGDAILDGL